LDLWYSGRSTDKNDFVNLSFTNLRVLKNVLNWWHTFSEEINAKLLELGSCDVEIIILTFSKGLTFNLGLMC